MAKKIKRAKKIVMFFMSSIIATVIGLVATKGEAQYKVSDFDMSFDINRALADTPHTAGGDGGNDGGLADGDGFGGNQGGDDGFGDSDGPDADGGAN